MYVRALVNHCGFDANKIYLLRRKLTNGIFAWRKKAGGDFHHLNSGQYEEVDEATARRERPELFEEEKPSATTEAFKSEGKIYVTKNYGIDEDKPQFLWKGYNSEAEYLQACIDKEKEDRLKPFGSTDELIKAWERGYRK